MRRSKRKEKKMVESVSEDMYYLFIFLNHKNGLKSGRKQPTNVVSPLRRASNEKLRIKIYGPIPPTEE